MTYSKGNFYKAGISPPTHKFDLYPQTSDTIQADARNVPLPASSLRSIVFDPPFLATTGASLEVDDSSNKINKRFGVFPSEKELHSFYISAMQEQYRLLTDKGILVFKCQDKVSSGTQYISHAFIIQEAQKIGFYCKDIFILVAKQRIVADWQKANQKHCRKFHSYYLVFEKSKKVVKYL